MEHIDQLNFLSKKEVKEVSGKFGTPVFVYDEKYLRSQAKQALRFNVPYGLTVRYAMKANPLGEILKIFQEEGIEIDASSEYEALRAIKMGIKPDSILLTSQEFPKDIEALVNKGVEFNACSLHQLESYGKAFPGTDVSIRINPGLGSGHSSKTNVGGPASSFGIWHEYVDEVKEIVSRYNLTVKRLHTHIGSGNNPEVWARVARMSLDQVREFEDVEILNLGGGFKVARMKEDIPADLEHISSVVAKSVEDFAKDTGRELHLEIEPGTFMVANGGSLISAIQDMTDTGEEGYNFIKIDAGMTEILRPNLYGSQHPLVIVGSNSDEHEKYVVVGHCCESGDLITPYPGDPEALSPRLLNKAKIGDLLVIEGVGGYCATMNARNYNSFPKSSEVLRKENGELEELSRRENLEDILSLEETA